MVREIWRYPVKSMAGERLAEARLGPLGIEGDRVVRVENARGRVVTARTHPRLLGHRATLGHDGEPLVDGRPWGDGDVAAAVESIAGPGARLRRDESAARFDVLPLLVATDGAIRVYGYDGRRLRANLVIGGVSGLAERTWEGKRMRIGENVIALTDLRARCVMTTFDPDTIEQNRSALRRIVERFGGTLGLNANVLRGGRLRQGQAVELVAEDEREVEADL